MTQVKFSKVASLGAQLTADSFYFVYSGSGNFAEAYLTDTAGNAKGFGNSAMITQVAQALINSSLADFNALEIVANIGARDALAAGKQRNFIVLVTNATGDNTVASGAALYAWNETTSSFTKLSEFESMDVTLQWSNINGRPTSSVATIDDAVTKRHAHTNLAILEKIGEDGSGNPTYNGTTIGSNWVATGW